MSVCTLVAAIAAAEAPLQAQEAWWNQAWAYRRVVTTGQFKPTNLPGEDIAVVTMPTGGLVLPDGSDIRVTTHDRRELPCRALMLGPGDQVRLAFALRQGITKYFVYYGNPKPGPAKELEIQRGVLQETWEFVEGPGIKTLEQIKRVFAGSNKLLGRDMRDRIFMGHNPFGWQNKIATVFTGWLNCPADGEYIFCSSSQDASFLLIDDKLVLDNGGHHQPQYDVSKRAATELKAGLHKITFYHVCVMGEPVAVAAWRPPGRPDIIPIPPGAYAPTERAAPGMMEKFGQIINIDFLPVHGGETFMADRYYQRYVFEALAAGQGGGKIAWTWDFGDGQTSSAAKVEHVYLQNGKYAVMLTGKTSAGEMKRVNQILVSRPWNEVTLNKLDILKQHAEIVAAYDFKTLDVGALPEAVQLLRRAGSIDAMMSAGAAFVARDKAPPEAVAEVLPSYCEALVARGKADQAIEALLKASTMTQNPAVCAEALTQAGAIALESKNDPKKAMELYQRVLKQYAAMTTHKSIREARIGVGDVYRYTGDYEQASKAYEGARIRSEDVMKKAAVLRGDFARQAEEFIRRREFDFTKEALERWEDTFPMDKLDGYWSLLRVKMLVGLGNHEAAIREAEVLERVNSGSNYTPELLLLAAESYRKLGQADRARTTLQRIVEKYRESKLAEEAAKRLKEK